MSIRKTRTVLTATLGLALGLAGATASAAAPRGAAAEPASVQSRAGGQAGIQASYPCGAWTFCAWDHSEGQVPGWWGLEWSGTIRCGSDLKLWEMPHPQGGTWRDRLGSIKNNTSGTILLQDAVNGTWVTRFTAREGAWGRLPAGAQNNVDRLVFICT